MGQAVLVVLLLQGAYVVGDEEIRPLPGIVVMPDVVGHPVVEPADPDLAVERHLLLRACGDLPRAGTASRQSRAARIRTDFFIVDSLNYAVQFRKYTKKSHRRR